MPVPYQRKPNVQLTQHRMDRFIEVLKATGLVTTAAKAAGVSAPTVYRARERDVGFMAEWDEAKETFADGLELAAYDQAVLGVPEDVFFKDQKIATKRVYSAKLLEILLRKNRPAEFRENQAAAHLSIDAGVLIVGPPAASTEEWLAKYKAIEAKHEIIDDD